MRVRFRGISYKPSVNFYKRTPRKRSLTTGEETPVSSPKFQKTIQRRTRQ